MEPKDEEDIVNDQLFKQPKLANIGVDFVKAHENRKLGTLNKTSPVHLHAFAEDVLIRKDYKEMKCELPGTPRSTFLMVFSPDGTKVASTHGNHNIYVTDIRSGKNIKTLVGHPRTPWCIAFHPTSNQIVASGCLGGQVRIWDLSGGSEVWTAGSQSVIASIAFHPNDRILVIATCNEVYFWDWSKPEPFVHTATNNPREKVRYVAFDKLGHKLITGIANSPQTRWERVRAPVPVPRQAERSASPYRRRITPRYLTNNWGCPPQSAHTLYQSERPNLSDVTERERRISASYRNLVHEYEILVHRYMQVYRPPAMIDRGTDPMEMTSNNTSSPTTSSNAGPSAEPSTSGTQQETSGRTRTTPFIRMYSLRFAPLRLIRGTQTSTPSRSPNDPATTPEANTAATRQSQNEEQSSPNVSVAGDGAHGHTSRRVLNLTPTSPLSIPTTNSETSAFKMHIRCSPKQKSPRAEVTNSLNGTQDIAGSSNPQRNEEPNQACSLSSNQTKPNNNQQVGTSGANNTTQSSTISQINSDMREMNQPEFLRLLRQRRELKSRIKRIHSGLPKKINRRSFLESSSDSTSSEDDLRSKRTNRSRYPPCTDCGTSATNTPTDTQPSTSQTNPSNTETTTSNSTTNFNMILEHLVTNLLTDNTSNTNMSTTTTGNSSNAGLNTSHNVSNNVSGSPAEPPPNPPDAVTGSSARTSASVFLRRGAIYYGSRRNTPNRPPLPLRRNSTSAFLVARPRIRMNNLSPMINRLNNLGVTVNPPPDEVVNYSERMSSDEEPAEREFLHFEPNGDLPSISPENIGIGNMYLNIVQDLESSLNDVRNIRASNRPGETSDMLSSFSERLESIMNQSDTILRNLRHSMDMLATNSERAPPADAETEDNFYVRDQSSSNASQNANAAGTRVVEYNEQRGSQYVNLPHGDGYNPLTSDHTYPRNPGSTADTMTPLMTSLHLTISHVQRQASLLRRQVESIERIDRAMLEVAQIQVIRQLFVDMHSYMSNLTGNDSHMSGVSSVRHMMAGTRISDNYPYDPSREETSSAPQNSSSEPEPGPSTSRTDRCDPSRIRNARNRSARKTYPPSRFFRMQRQGRRPHLANFFSKRYVPRDMRTIRRCFPHKPYNGRPTGRSNDHPSINLFILSPDMLVSMTRRLELLLMDQTRYIGMLENDDASNSETVSSDLENTIRATLTRCRARMNRVLGYPPNFSRPNESVTVTADGASRYTARNTLSTVIDTLSRFIDENTNLRMSPSMQNQIQGVLSLSFLLSEILLLRIVDSIPPPTGMNLDPERESLTSRIDQMCSEMLQRRLSGQNHQLTRSLRLMRLTVRHATRALNQTYTARRNAIIPPRTESRQELFDSIYRCIQNIQEQRNAVLNNNSEDRNSQYRELNRTYYEIISRYGRNNADNSNLNAETGEQLHRARASPINLQNIVASLSDNEDNESDLNTRYNNSSESASNAAASLYRSSNINLLNNEGSSSSSSSSSQFRPWNIPTVQVNDVPISEANSTFNPRSWNRHRFNVSASGLFRPRFLHPLYSGVNPFDADLDDSQREQIYENDVITTVTPNHRIQVWDISTGVIPVISNPLKNVVVSDCKIHNDASVDIAADGTILVTLLPSGGYINVTNRLGVYSLRWESLGQCLYITSFEQNAVSVSLSPLSRHLVVGLASRRVSIVPNDKWTMARIFVLEENPAAYGSLPVVRELEQNRDARATSYKSLNCIRWLPFSGQGLVYATNTGQLIVLT